MGILPSGHSPLDTLLYGGLWPEQVVQIVGPPHSGKTFLGLLFCKSISKAIWIDVGKSFPQAHARHLGLNPDIIIIQKLSLELINDLYNEYKPQLIVLDDLNLLVPKFREAFYQFCYKIKSLYDIKILILSNNIDTSAMMKLCSVRLKLLPLKEEIFGCTITAQIIKNVNGPAFKIASYQIIL